MSIVLDYPQWKHNKYQRHQILADQLTLFGPGGGQILPAHITTDPPDF